MSASDTLAPVGIPRTPDRPKRNRFAGERLGAWIFAASFSIGIWGLALKVLSPAHPVATATAHRHYAELAPSDAADGRASVVWGSDAIDSATGYPITDGVPLTALNPSAGPGSRHD